MPAPVIVVLGVHRSGTSLLAQVLSRLGVALGGDLVGPNRFNEDGHWEHAQILEVQEQLLKALGRQWFWQGGSVPLPDGWLRRPVARQARRRLIEIVTAELGAAGDRPWAFKDPRTVRLLPLWHEVFEAVQVVPDYVLTVRPPAAVVRSLRRRDGLAPASAALLWLTSLQEAATGVPDALVVDYDAWFDSDPGVLARRLSDGLELDADADTLASLAGSVREELRHWREESEGEGDIACPALELATEMYSGVRGAEALSGATAAFWARIMAYRQFADVFSAWPERWEKTTRQAARPQRRPALDPEEIRRCPWRTEPYDAARFQGIKSMLVREEQQMLYWLSHHAGEEGCIVDAGAFLGGSTAHLADGILNSPNRLKRVHSFDLFKPTPYARREYDLDGVDSLLPMYAANIAPWSRRITIYPGDIVKSGWVPEPIEILFLDCLKTPAIGDWAIRHFFPSLKPGSIVIQRDTLHAQQPWIQVAMGYFADHFSYLADTRVNSALYVCKGEISADEAQRFTYADIGLSARLELFERAIAPFAEPTRGELRDRAAPRLTGPSNATAGTAPELAAATAPAR